MDDDNPLSNTIQEDMELFTEEDFYGLNVPDAPPEQVDDEIQYLHSDDRQSILNQFNDDQIQWKECLISDPEEDTVFVLDRAVKESWGLFCEEVEHIRETLPKLVRPVKTNNNNEEEDQTPSEFGLKDILDLAFGKESDFYTVFCKEVDLPDRITFVNFMATLCIQMAYKETPSAMYDKYSLLKDKMVLEKEVYIGIFKRLATKRKVYSDNYIGSTRRGECIWERLEQVVNKLLRKLSIIGRHDYIPIALDDDKVWVQTSGKNQEDDFGLRKVTHVKDNRRGIVVHTAISATTNIPLGFTCERKGDTAAVCFKHLFKEMFPVEGRKDGDLPDLSGVTNHSDRGYTQRSTTFDFLLPAGCDFTNTVKRIMPFPYVWGMKLSDNDSRVDLQEKGAPTLYISTTTQHNRLVTCAAFRTGTNNISAVLTTKVHGHQWEGICLSHKQRTLYENDPVHGLDSYLFPALTTIPSLFDLHHEDIKEILDELKEKVNVLTLEQGTADWHKGRQFSATSSQASNSFRKAFILYQSDNDWCDVAEYQFGKMYHERFDGVLPRRMEVTVAVVPVVRREATVVLEDRQEERRAPASSPAIPVVTTRRTRGAGGRQGQRQPAVRRNESLVTDTNSASRNVEELSSSNDGGSGRNANMNMASSSSPTSPTSMIEYFQSIDVSSLSSDNERDALGIILDKIIHATEATDILIPNHLFASSSNSKTRKEMLNMLSSRVPEAQRQKRAGDAVLKKWVMGSNTTRALLFFSKDALIENAARMVGVRLAANLSIDKMIAKIIEVASTRQGDEGAPDDPSEIATGPDASTLIDTTTNQADTNTINATMHNNTDDGHINTATGVSNDNSGRNHQNYVSVTQEITKADLVKSFMRQLKGQAREHCQMGHKLELPIGRNWMNDWNRKPVDGFQVISLHKVGLVSKVNEPWAKDSIDFIAFVSNESTSEIELWGVEIKSRQTHQTMNKEREYMRQIHRKKYELINANQAFRYVPAADERYQLLHHAYVYGLKRVALIVGRKDSKVLSGTIINYDYLLRESYGKVIEKIKNISLLWAYDGSKVIPDDVLSIAKDIKVINGEETLYGTLKLWKKMYSDPSILPRPTLQRIIPSTHAKWNATKGGSDTITKLVDDCFIHPPRNYTNFESVASSCCISNLLATSLKLYQIISANKDLTATYPSMQHYRNAASHRATFKKFLLMAFELTILNGTKPLRCLCVFCFCCCWLWSQIWDENPFWAQKGDQVLLMDM